MSSRDRVTRRSLLQASASGLSSSCVGWDARPYVACLGDSVTAGTGLDRPDAESYPAQLQESLARRAAVANLGVPGAAVGRDSDIPFWGSGKLDDAAALHPQVVVLLIGTNDSKPQNWRSAASFEASLHDLASKIIAKTATRSVVLASPPPAWANPYGISPEIVANEIVPSVARVALTVGSPFVDLWELFRAHKGRFSDGVHPDALGAGQIAVAVLPSVVRVLATGASPASPKGRTQ